MKELDVPLFPGYLFCRYEERARCKILSTAGVLRILGYGDRPVPVNDDEMAAIERVTQSGYECHPMEYLGTGCRVRVNSGALKGLEGRVIAVKAKKQRFVVSLTLLQRSVAVEVEVEADCLSPCETAFQTES